MNNLTVSIFGNKVFLEILEELNLFSNSKIMVIESLESNFNNNISNEHIIVFFLNEKNIDSYHQLKKKNLPFLVVVESSKFIRNYFDRYISPQIIIYRQIMVILTSKNSKFCRKITVERAGYRNFDL